MELALLLIVMVIAELCLTVWFLARQRDYKRQVKALTDTVAGLDHDLGEVSKRIGLATETVRTSAAETAKAEETLKGLVGQASPDELMQAQQLLRSLGLAED